LKKISDTRYLIPFIGMGRLKENHESQDPLNNFVIVLDDVRDHGNIGTIIRTARAFGIRDIITTRQDVDLWYKKIIEASRGKIFDICLKRFRSPQETISFLQKQGFQVIATSPHAPLLQPAAQLQPKPIALVVGNETTGVSDEILQTADLVVQIPMSKQVESLNVGVATGISVYEFKLKLVLAMLTKYIRTTLGREVNVTGKLIQMAFDKRLKEITKFSSTQVILLMILKCDETMTLQQVSKDTATFDEELQELLRPLLDGGYIRYCEEMSPETIQLTDNGEQLLGQLWGMIESTEENILQGFTDEEKRRFTEYLHRVQTNCEQIIG
jgi:TrmH family RNA methyltransferase